MHRGRASAVVLFISIAATIAILTGCGGSDGPRLPGVIPPGGGQGAPPPGTANIQGLVVSAQNPGTTIGGALIGALGTVQTVLSDAQGDFTLVGLPVGQVTLDVSFPSTGQYQAMRITVETVADEVTSVTIAAVGSSTTMPNAVTITPASTTIDIGGEIPFTTTARALGLPVNVYPSFSSTGGIGTVAADGRFTATTIGTGKVTAHFPDASATATVAVVGPRSPLFGIINVSPATLPADGGDVRFAINATDGDGVAGVTAQIELPDGSLITTPLALTTGSAKDGTWAAVYRAKANDNTPGADGKQQEQRYSVRLIAEDNSGAITNSVWTDFVVAGLDAPPPPP